VEGFLSHGLCGGLWKGGWKLDTSNEGCFVDGSHMETGRGEVEIGTCRKKCFLPGDRFGGLPKGNADIGARWQTFFSFEAASVAEEVKIGKPTSVGGWFLPWTPLRWSTRGEPEADMVRDRFDPAPVSREPEE